MRGKQGEYFYSQFISEEARPRDSMTMAVVLALPHPKILSVQT